MAEGINTFKGLAVPLQGESEITQLHIAYDILTLSAVADNTSDYLVLQDSDGTECFFVNYLGRIQQVAAWVAADTMVTAIGSWASFYGGANFKMTVADQAVGQIWLTGATISLDFAGTTGISNTHGATIGLRYNTTASNGAGSASVLTLLYEEESGAVTPADAGFAWFNLYNIATSDGTVPNLFQLHLAAEDSGCFVGLTAGEATKGLKFIFNNTQYYIMCATCTG